MMALPPTTRALRCFPADALVGGSVTVVAMALIEISISQAQFGQHRCLRHRSVEINPYDGENGVSVVTAKVVEGLLLNAK